MNHNQTGSRPIALLGLPNTGTDWLVDLILRQNPSLKYYREFFNPICNEDYQDVLSRAFGCEMLDNYEMIARPDCPCEEVFEQTWACESYNFTKENFSAFKVGWFVHHFDCFLLHRRIELTLPGQRLQVKTWYSALFWSLVRNRKFLPRELRALVQFALDEADTLNKRQAAAFAIFSRHLLEEARRYSLRVVDYDCLMTLEPPELTAHLAGLPGVVDPERLAHDVRATRRTWTRKFDDLEVSAFLVRLLEEEQRIAEEMRRRERHPTRRAMRLFRRWAAVPLKAIRHAAGSATDTRS
jgi:hypothetical protein